MKFINKYIFPISIIILLLAFVIWASTKKESFVTCRCPRGTTLRNNRCYSCTGTETLSNDRNNPMCIVTNRNGTTFSKPPSIKKCL